MTRPLRLESPGNLYHVTVRGDRKERIFESDADRVSLLQLINEAADLHPVSYTHLTLPTIYSV